MKGVRIACLYSYKCNRATKLGINEQLLEYVQNYDCSLEKGALIISLLKKLDSYSGYKITSELMGAKNCFDERIVRIYWLGSNCPELSSFNHNFAILEKIRIINHDEHLRSPILKEILDCAVSFGNILKLKDKKAEVLNYRLLYKEGKIVFEEETRIVDIRFLPDLKKGDLVSIHWAIAREKISLKRKEFLCRIILESIKKLRLA